MAFLIRMVKTVLISLFTAISGLLCIIIGWYQPGYAIISKYIWSSGLLLSGGIRIRFNKPEYLSELPPAIFCANHRSHFDIPALMRSAPRPLYFIAKKELKKVPFLGWGMQAVGMIFIDRKNPDRAKSSMKKAGNAIKKGKSIVTFPEGTRSKTHTMLPFKKGAFHLAKGEGIPVVPVAVSGTEKILPPGGRIKGGEIEVRFGEPIDLREIERLTVNELALLTRQKIEALLIEMEQEKIIENPEIA